MSFPCLLLCLFGVSAARDNVGFPCLLVCLFGAFHPGMTLTVKPDKHKPHEKRA